MQHTHTHTKEPNLGLLLFCSSVGFVSNYNIHPPTVSEALTLSDTRLSAFHALSHLILITFAREEYYFYSSINSSKCCWW